MSMDKSVIGVVWVQVFVHLALFFLQSVPSEEQEKRTRRVLGVG